MTAADTASNAPADAANPTPNSTPNAPAGESRRYRWRLWLALGSVLVLGALVAGGLYVHRLWTAGPDRHGIAFFPDMHASVPYDPYDPYPTADAAGAGARVAVRRLPPAGAIPIEQAPFAYKRGDAEAERAGHELVNPLAGVTDPEVLARGRRVYETFCRVCHGDAGAGDGPVVRAGFYEPPDLRGKRTKEYADGRLYHVITRGQGGMPPYAAQVRPADRWRVIGYLRTLQGFTFGAPHGPTPGKHGGD